MPRQLITKHLRVGKRRHRRNKIRSLHAYHLDGYAYCSDCYHEEVDKNRSIHDYSYKPEPIFYGDSMRYFDVELEIDGAGKDSDNADEILSVGNRNDEVIYIKSDVSLDDGMEIVSHASFSMMIIPHYQPKAHIAS